MKELIPNNGGGESPAERSGRLKLISIGSLTIMQTPPSDTTSDFGKTPGKTPLLLPASESQSFSDLLSETSSIEDREMVLD